MKRFISTERKGFKMTFDNGLTVSVQWGATNYCDNKVFDLNELANADFGCLKDAESDTAEVAILLNDIFIKPYIILGNRENSVVLGYLSAEEVVDIMNKVKNYDKDKVETLKVALGLASTYQDNINTFP